MTFFILLFIAYICCIPETQLICLCVCVCVCMVMYLFFTHSFMFTILHLISQFTGSYFRKLQHRPYLRELNLSNVELVPEIFETHNSSRIIIFPLFHLEVLHLLVYVKRTVELVLALVGISEDYFLSEFNLYFLWLYTAPVLEFEFIQHPGQYLTLRKQIVS